MKMICKWVHADDGALIMHWAVTEWVRVGGPETQWGTADSEVACAFDVFFDDHADALTPVGV
jgi:hypothetical protein